MIISCKTEEVQELKPITVHFVKIDSTERFIGDGLKVNYYWIYCDDNNILYRLERDYGKTFELNVRR